MNQTLSPKKPQSAYFLFSKDKRSEYKQKFPGLTSQDITKQLAKAFKELAPEDRKVWEDEYIKQKQDYEKTAGQSSGKKKTKSQGSDDDRKIKASPVMTRHQSHEKENPHMTRSHGKVTDQNADTKHHDAKKQERGPSPHRPSKQKNSPTTTPKGTMKKTKPDTDQVVMGDLPRGEMREQDVAEIGPLEPVNRNLSTEDAVENFREQNKEEVNTMPQHHWQTGIEKAFTERRPDTESANMNEERLPTTEMQEQESKQKKSPMRDGEGNRSPMRLEETGRKSPSPAQEKEEIQIPRRDPIHAFPEHPHPIPHEDQMTVEREGVNEGDLAETPGFEKSRKVKVLDTNKKLSDSGRRSPVSSDLL